MFVNSQNLNQITYNGAALSWQAIGLTPGSNPVSDTSRYSSQANATLIYNLNGEQVSNTSAGNTLTMSAPASHAVTISVGVKAPGMTSLS